MAVTSQTAKLMLTGHVWSSAQSVAADGFESEEFTACPRAKTIAPSTIRRVGGLKAGDKSSKFGVACTKKMLRQRLFSSQDSEDSNHSYDVMKVWDSLPLVKVEVLVTEDFNMAPDVCIDIVKQSPGPADIVKPMAGLAGRSLRARRGTVGKASQAFVPQPPSSPCGAHKRPVVGGRTFVQ